MSCNFPRIFVYLFCFSTLYHVSNSKSRDFYKILNIKKSATTKEIKSAYRKLAKELHPDKNKNDPEAETKFQDINAAYEVLSDKEKRQKYNRGGEDALKDENKGNSGGFWPFGGRQSDPGTPKGDKVVIKVDITLEEIYNSEFVEFVRYKTVPKETAGKRKCNCRYEMRQQRNGNRIQMFQVKVCDECNNVKLVLEESELEFEVEKGSPEKFDETYFYGEGEVEIDGDQGDLQVVYNILKHPKFERRGNDLFTNVTINLEDSLTGFSMEIDHLDNRKVEIKREEITWPGMKMKIKDEGMPDYRDNSRKGNLWITFDVEFPRGKLEKSKIGEIFSGYKYSGGNDKQRPVFYNGLQGY